MKTRFILFAVLVFVARTGFAQQTLEIPIDSIGKTYPVSINVTNGVSSDFTWDKTGGNTVINTVFSTTTGALTSTQNLTFNPAATAGMSSVVTVTVANTLANTCDVKSSDLTVSIVNTPTFNAVIAAADASQNVCQNATAANLSFSISGPVGSVVSNVAYTIGSTSSSLAVNTTIPASGSIPVSINLSGYDTGTVGSEVLTINTVSGTSGTSAISSNQTGTGKTQTINIRAIPALGNFSF